MYIKQSILYCTSHITCLSHSYLRSSIILSVAKYLLTGCCGRFSFNGILPVELTFCTVRTCNEKDCRNGTNKHTIQQYNAH